MKKLCDWQQKTDIVFIKNTLIYKMTVDNSTIAIRTL